MSQKNTGGKRAARERLLAERARQRAADRRKRALVIGGAVVAVLAVIAVIGVIIGTVNSNKKEAPWKEALKESADVTPPGTVGPEGTMIPVGNSDAKAVLTIYEDFRCPVCRQVEHDLGPTVRQMMDEGKFRVRYQVASFLDGKLGGNGSKYAANAAGCAQEAGKFAQYHDVLFANQPDELDDRFGNRGRLIELAGQVEGLRTPQFEACVNDLKYAGWVNRSEEQFQKGTVDGEQITGTPTFSLNDKPVEVIIRNRGIATPEEFRAQVDEILKTTPEPPAGMS